ncbi:DUF1622 domain-containing protein [Sediminicoccus sp. KRV36]|uniref:DUF1622 domain-containing protein n=1 Tax=Sediminicoccus sp. KRV36 TaxID=3133721 RepID=UPI00200C3556|nr:DUF1622 domain-containing protein [Sediminicoccus rosea]UPY37418.1 DUF1622 domain-containing protein [Sediminicoccus rosea]
MHLIHPPEELESAVAAAAAWLKLGTEALSVAIILASMAIALARLLAGLLRRPAGDVRMGLARGLSLALEFQLAADIVGTAISPDWDQIGKLAAVAAIRTFLNYFLQRELAGEAATASAPFTPADAAPPGPGKSSAGRA